MKKPKQMPERAKIIIALTFHEESGALNVFVGDEKPKFGAASHVIEKDGVTLAVRSDGDPVFIRIANAQNCNRTFQSIAKRAKEEKPVRALQWDHVLAFCLKKTNKMLELDKQRKTPKITKYVFNTVA